MSSTHTPRVYVGTYGKYASGSLDGKWINLEDYVDKEDFLESIAELHSDEEDPEFMFQDWEGVPDCFISESGIEEEAWDFFSFDGLSEDAKYAVAEECSSPDEFFSKAGDAIEYPGCHDVEDVARWHIGETGGVNELPKNQIDYYLDYWKIGRDFEMDFDDEGEGISVFEAYGVDEDDYESLGEEIVSQLGMDAIGDPEYYFDFEAYGRDLEIEGDFISYPGGMIEIM